MSVREFFKPSMPKIVLTFFFLAMTVFFMFQEQNNMLIFTSWLMIIAGPIFKILKIADSSESIELFLLFCVVVVSPYIQSCFIFYKKEPIKNFLKPTKGKIIIFILFLVLSSVPYIGAIPQKKERFIAAPNILENSDLIRTFNETIDTPNSYNPEPLEFYTVYTFNPVFWLPYWFSGLIFNRLDWKIPYEMSGENLPIVNVFAGDILTKDLRVGFIGILIYWYLLSCLIEVLISKWKNRR